MPDSSPLIILGKETSQFDPRFADGAFPLLPGAVCRQVLRTTRARPDLADGMGWTYAHHQDLAAWQGRLYVAWGMCPVDEDLPPYRILYSTSGDGVSWSEPQELFPLGMGWALRFYFYLSTNGRMLAFCTPTLHDAGMETAGAGMLLVREIRADHTLGPVYTLLGSHAHLPESYTQAPDDAFRQACQEAAANDLLLEQSDYGTLLGERRMSWHAVMPKIAGWPFGKAFCFYHRQDGAIVGLCKKGWVTISHDEGRTWSKPVVPDTLRTGGAKVWGQRTHDGRYAMLYNPSDQTIGFRRYPLCVAAGEDGHTFGPLRVVHGETTRYRYAGLHKDMGAQYVRGLAEWADDGSFNDDGLWVVYSVHKEDIWVARLPLPILSDPAEAVDDDFSTFSPTAFPPGWNLSVPAWGRAAIVATEKGRFLELSSSDPHLPLTATRCFSPRTPIKMSLSLQHSEGEGPLYIDLLTQHGARLASLTCEADGRVWADNDGHETLVGALRGLSVLTIAAGAAPGRWKVTVDGVNGPDLNYTLDYDHHPDYGFSQPFARLSLRTASALSLAQAAQHIEVSSDFPTHQTSWQIACLAVA